MNSSCTADPRLVGAPVSVVRREFGNIESFVNAVPSSQTASLVPSLGAYLDNFLDAFGYTNVSIYCLHNAWLNSKDLPSFAALLKDTVLLTECEWFWNNIDHEQQIAFCSQHFL